MAIRFYDEAISNKIINWVKDPNLRIYKPNETARMIQLLADESNDKPLELPVIIISRLPEVTILNPHQKPMTFDGAHLDANQSKSKVLNGVPISIDYQLDIYTKYFEEADEYARNFVFNFINYPKLLIEIPYNDSKFIHESSIRIQPTIADNSDIPEQLVSGQFTRLSLRLTIDDAYMFSAPIMDNWKLEYDNKNIKLEGE